MDAERNKKIVKATWDAFWSGDVYKGLVNMSEDIVWYAPGGNSMGGPKRGKAEIRKFRFTELDVFRELRRTVVGIYGDGDTVVMELKAEGTLRNGDPYDNSGCVVYDLENGKIVRVRQYVDTQKAMALNKLFKDGELQR
jgi:ketosteroid isomerase-like protein